MKDAEIDTRRGSTPLCYFVSGAHAPQETRIRPVDLPLMLGAAPLLDALGKLSLPYL